MRTYVAIVYNQPQTSRYDGAHEEKAVLGVLEAVAAVREALLELEYGVSLLPLTPPWPEAREELEALNADIVFNLFEGFCGEPETEALVPQTLAELKIPLTGCPAPALRLALDKARVKVILQAAGIPTPDFQLLNPRTLHLFRLGFPCIVKPRGEDASHGISDASVVTDFSALEEYFQPRHHRGQRRPGCRLAGKTGDRHEPHLRRRPSGGFRRGERVQRHRHGKLALQSAAAFGDKLLAAAGGAPHPHL